VVGDLGRALLRRRRHNEHGERSSCRGDVVFGFGVAGVGASEHPQGWMEQQKRVGATCGEDLCARALSSRVKKKTHRERAGTAVAGPSVRLGKKEQKRKGKSFHFLDSTKLRGCLVL